MKNGVLVKMCWPQKTRACSQDSGDNTSQRARPINHHVFYLKFSKIDKNRRLES